MRHDPECRSVPELEAVIAAVPVGTDIEVFRDRQVPYRGTVTEAFVSSALACIPDGMEFLVVSLETKAGSRTSSGSATGDSHQALREILDEFSGRDVALGTLPPFWEPDGDALVSAAKGGIDGPR